MVNPNKKSKYEIVLIHLIIKSKHENENEGEKEKKKKRLSERVHKNEKESDERFLEAQTMSEFKDGKEKLNE